MGRASILGRLCRPERSRNLLRTHWFSFPSLCWGVRERIEMFLSRDASIERKLTFVMMATSLLGLSLACLCFEIYERVSYRAAITSELTALSQTLGANTTASLAFNDHQSAVDILSALGAERHIVAACLYDRHGDFFAAYQRKAKISNCSTHSSNVTGLNSKRNP